MLNSKKKQQHKDMLIDILVDYLSFGHIHAIEAKYLRSIFNRLSYRKIKKVCKCLDVYINDYDASPSLADEIVDHYLD